MPRHLGREFSNYGQNEPQNYDTPFWDDDGVMLSLASWVHINVPFDIITDQFTDGVNDQLGSVEIRFQSNVPAVYLRVSIDDWVTESNVSNAGDERLVNFGNLVAGAYVFKVRVVDFSEMSDTYGYYNRALAEGTYEVPFVIRETGKYKTKYRLEFQERQVASGTSVSNIRLDISQRGYTGSRTDICGQEEPVVLEYDSSGDLYQHIVSGRLTMNLIDENDTLFSEFVNTTMGEHMVTLTQGGDIKFQGYIVPNSTRRKVEAPPSRFTVYATDGIGMLKNIPAAYIYGDKRVNFNYRDGTFFSTMQYELKRILQYSFTWMVHNSLNNTPLFSVLEVYLEDVVDDDTTMYDLLEIYARSLYSRIFFSGNELWVQMLGYKSVTNKIFKYVGNVWENQTELDVYKTLGCDGDEDADLVYIGNALFEESLKQAGTVRLKYKQYLTPEFYGDGIRLGRALIFNNYNYGIAGYGAGTFKDGVSDGLGFEYNIADINVPVAGLNTEAAQSVLVEFNVNEEHALPFVYQNSAFEIPAYAGASAQLSIEIDLNYNSNEDMVIALQVFAAGRYLLPNYTWANIQTSHTFEDTRFTYKLQSNGESTDKTIKIVCDPFDTPYSSNQPCIVRVMRLAGDGTTQIYLQDIRVAVRYIGELNSTQFLIPREVKGLLSHTLDTETHNVPGTIEYDLPFSSAPASGTRYPTHTVFIKREAADDNILNIIDKGKTLQDHIFTLFRSQNELANGLVIETPVLSDVNLYNNIIYPYAASLRLIITKFTRLFKSNITNIQCQSVIDASQT